MYNLYILDLGKKVGEKGGGVALKDRREGQFFSEQYFGIL